MLLSQRIKSYLLLLILLVFSTSTITEDYKEDESNVEISLAEGEIKEVKVNSTQTLTITGSLVDYQIGDGLTLSIFYHERTFFSSTACYTIDKESKQAEFQCKDDVMALGSDYYNYFFIRDKEEYVGFKAEVSITLLNNQTVTVLASIPKPVDLKYDFKDFHRFTYNDVTKYMPFILKFQIQSNETEQLKKNLLFLQNDCGFFYYTNETFGNATVDSHLKVIESTNIDKVEHYFKILYKNHGSKIQENITVDFTIEQSDIDFEYIRDSKRPMKTYNYDIKDKNQTYTIIYDYNFIDHNNFDFIEYFKGDCVVRRKALFNDSSATTLFPNENDTLSKSDIFFEAVSDIGAEIHQVLCETSGQVRLSTLHPENDKTLEIGTEDIFVIIESITVGIANTTQDSENITLLLIAATNVTINASFSIGGKEEQKTFEGTLEVQFTLLKDKENSMILKSSEAVALFIKVVPQWGVQEIVKPTMNVSTNAIFVPLNKPNVLDSSKVYTKVGVKITGVKEDLTYQMNHQMHNHPILPVKKNLDIATTIKKEEISKETFTVIVNNPYLEKDVNEDYKYYLTFYTEQGEFTNVYVNYTDINRNNYSEIYPGEIKIISSMQKSNTSQLIQEEYLTEFSEDEGNMVIFYKTCGGKTDLVTEKLFGDNVEQRLINEELSTNYTALLYPNFGAEILLSAQYKSEKVPYYGLTLSYKYFKTGEQIDTETFTKLNDKQFSIKFDPAKSIISWDTYEEAKEYKFIYEFYLLNKTESDEKYINNECFLTVKKIEYQKELEGEENGNTDVIIIKNTTDASYHYDTPGSYLVNVIAYTNNDPKDSKLPFRYIYTGINIKIEEKIEEVTLKEGEVREFNSTIGSEIKFKVDLNKYNVNDENIIKLLLDDANDTVCECKVDNETDCKLLPSKEANEIQYLFKKVENSTLVQLKVSFKGNDTTKFKIGLNNLRKINILEFKEPFVEVKANSFFDELILVSNLPKEEEEKNTYLLFFKEKLDIHINGLYDTEKTLNQRLLVLDKKFKDKLNISITTGNIMIVVKKNENETRKLLVDKTDQEIVYAYNRNELSKIIINEKADKEINRVMYIVADYTGKKDSKYLNLYEAISSIPNIKYKTKDQMETSEKILPDQSSTSPDKEFFEDPCFETECLQLVMIKIQVPQGKHLYFKYHIVNDTENAGEIIPIDSKESIFSLVKGKDKSFNLSEEYDQKKINLLFETEFNNTISIKVNGKIYEIGQNFKSLLVNKVKINDTLIVLSLTSGETSFIIIKLEYSDAYETITRSAKNLKQHKILLPLFKVNSKDPDYTDFEINIFNIDVQKFIFYIDADITDEPILESDDSKWKGLYYTEGESIEHAIKLNLSNPYKEYDIVDKYHAFAAFSFYEEKPEDNGNLTEYMISINYIDKNDKDPEIKLEETEYATEGGKFVENQKSGKLIRNEDLSKTMFVIYNLCGKENKQVSFKTFEKSIESKIVENGTKTMVESIENYYEDVKVTFDYMFKSNHLEGFLFNYLYADNTSDLPLDEIKKGNEDKLIVSYDKNKKIISWEKLEENNIENYILVLIKVDNDEETKNINNPCYLHYLLNEKQDRVEKITLNKGTSEYKYSEEYEKVGYNHANIVANIKHGGKLVFNSAEIKKPDAKKKSNTGLIVGIIFGVIALIIILILVYCFCRKRKKVLTTEIENAKPLSEDFDVGVAKE